MRKPKWDWRAHLDYEDRKHAMYAEKALRETNERRRMLCIDLRELRQRGTARARRAAERNKK